MTIEINKDYTDMQNNQNTYSNSLNKTQILHRYPLRPRMGLKHTKYRKINDCNISCENNTDVITDKIQPISIDEDRLINNYCAERLLKQYSILQYERLAVETQKNKHQDEFKLKRQTLLNRMMPTMRQPIKARHSLYHTRNNKICESEKITEKKTQSIISETNNLCHDNANIWHPVDNCMIETNNNPVAFTSLGHSTYKRPKICTVPGIKRRCSIEETTLSRPSKLSFQLNKSLRTTVKRRCTNESCLMTRSNNENKLINLSSNTMETTTASLCDIQPNSSIPIIESSKSSSFTSASLIKRRSLPMKIKEWSKVASKQFSRRCSAGSVKSVQSATEHLNCENHSIHEKNLDWNIEHQQNSSRLRGIRRSAQQKFSNICKVLKYSNPSILAHSNCLYQDVDHSDQSFTSKSYHFEQHSDGEFDCDTLKHISFSSESSPKLRSKSVETNDEIIVSNYSSKNAPTLRSVILLRPDLDEPFGLFVIKSEQGYRITRLTERLKQNNQIHIDDEIVQVNAIHCSQLDVHDLQELFRNNQSIVLTIYDQQNHPLM